MSKTAYMRGLQNFIQDIRAAQNKEQEQRRVDKELAKIRARFHDDRSLSGYDRRKYVWKLLYIYMLGYDVEFGHKQAADLIPLPKYKDKQVGYMACSLLLRENDEFLRLTMNALRMDLTSRNEAFETLALSFIGNMMWSKNGVAWLLLAVGGHEMADALTQDVLKLLSSGTARPLVKKRAALALLRLIRKTSPDNQVVTADIFSPIINSLLEERDLGLLLSVTTLLQGVMARNGAAGYEGSQPRLIKILERLTMQREREVSPEYLYYGIPSPWLQCKCLRALQFFSPPEAPADRAVLNTILQGIIESVGTGDAAKNANPNKANALYAILFEAISLALQYDTDRAMLATCVSVLGSFLSAKEPNVKYLALETLSRLALVPEILEAIRHQQATVVASLKDADMSIRKRAMDLLFTMCDSSCAEDLVREMNAYLVVADFSIREELVLKVAILAEKFAPNVQWYVDVTLELLEKAGDFVSEEVWHRVVQLVTNNPAMQQYAARNVVQVLKRGARHESLVCTAAYILGEFGRLIVPDVTPLEQFKLLHEPFAAASQATKGLLLTAFIKIYLLDPQNATLRTEVLGIFEKFQKFMDAELQQRASEYLRIAAHPQAAAQQYFLPMPKWEERESSLLKRLQQTEGTDTDSMPQPMLAPAIAGSAPGSGTPNGTKLVVGGPVEETPAPPAPVAVPTQPSVDLLGDSPLAPPATGSGAVANGAANAPKKPANAVDMLSDLLGDGVIGGAAGGAAAPAPGMPPAAGHTGAPVMAGPTGANPVAAGPTGYQPLLPGAAVPSGFAPQYTGSPNVPPGFAPQYTGAAAGPTGAYPPQPTGGMPPQYTGAPHQAPGMPPQYTGAPGYPPQPTGATPYAPQATGAYAPQPTGGMPVQFTGATFPPQPTGGYAPQSTGAGYPPQPTGGYPPQSTGGYAPQATGNMSMRQSSSFAGPAGSAAAHAAMGVGADGMVKPTGNLDHWFNNLLIKDRGILYEDPFLQVGVQARYTRGTGQVVLFLGNKSKEGALQNVQVTAAPPAGLQLAVAGCPPMLSPGQQVQVPIQVAALAPFSGTPTLTLAYSMPPISSAPAGVQLRQELRLPVATHKFIVPEPTIPKELFFEQWKAHSAPPAKSQEMVERATPLTSPSVVSVLRLANLGVEHGYLDPSPHNEAGAGYFMCGQPGGPEQSVLVMIRVEGNPQTMAQFRVTVCSPAPALSAQAKDLLVTHLRATAA